MVRRQLKNLNVAYVDPSETSESQPQGRVTQIREVAEQYEYTSPGINKVRSPMTQLDIYDDLAKNQEKIDFDIYNQNDSAKG